MDESIIATTEYDELLDSIQATLTSLEDHRKR